MEQNRRYGSISRANNDRDNGWENNTNEGIDRLDISSASYQEYDMTYLIAPTMSFPQKMERCFRFSVPLLIGALFLWAAGMLFSSSAVRCGGYPTDPKFCFKNNDATSTQTTKAHGVKSWTSTPNQKFQATFNDTMAATSMNTKNTEQSSILNGKNQISAGRSMCFQNPSCRNLGLQGECCPTTAGVYLGCCSPSNTKSHDTTKSTTTNPSTKGISDEILRQSSPSCASNPNCHSLGLMGDCCPTSKGIQLSCCHS